jgi:phospholipid/cholesterol/gamma-HCH transport system substrate-binding protein
VKRAIRKYLRDFIAIIVLGVIAAAVAGYVLSHERLRFPLIQSSPYTINAAFSTAQAVTPGQGQTVRVSGIQVGDISSVKLENGQAIVAMSIDPSYKKLIHTDASALLRPKTGLKDMFIELNPGSKSAPLAKPGYTIPVANTLPDINPDEILGSLDVDTREYLQLLVNGAGEGLKGAGGQLQDVLARFGPTHRDLARITTLLSQRQAHLAHLIHTLNLLNQELKTRGPELPALVRAANKVFTAIGSEQANVGQAVAELPAALKATTSTLGKVQTLAQVLHPTATALTPVAASLTRANAKAAPFFAATAPILQNEIRPFTRNAQPIVRQLITPAKQLSSASPALTNTFVVLNHLFNMLGYNPYGSASYDASKNGTYLFWLAWLAHNGGAVFSTTDANGPLRALTITSTCETLKALTNPINDPTGGVLAALNLGGILSNPALCGT